MTDLIRRADADAAIVACKGNGATRQACRDAISALPTVTVGADAVLEAAHKYLLEQYGASPLAHPIDRARILAALDLTPAPDPAAIREAAAVVEREIEQAKQLMPMVVPILRGVHRSILALIQKGTADDRA